MAKSSAAHIEIDRSAHHGVLIAIAPLPVADRSKAVI